MCTIHCSQLSAVFDSPHLQFFCFLDDSSGLGLGYAYFSKKYQINHIVFSAHPIRRHVFLCVCFGPTVSHILKGPVLIKSMELRNSGEGEIQSQPGLNVI